MSLNKCWHHINRIWTIRCWRMKRIAICSSIFTVIIIIIYLTIMIFLLSPSKNKNTISDYLTTIVNEQEASVDNEMNDDGFSSLRRQHRLKESNSNLEDDVQINQPSLSIDLKSNNQSSKSSITKAKHLAISNGDKSMIISGIKCRNSMQGKLLITDDRGRVCQRQHININGCCNDQHFETKKFVCDTCQVYSMIKSY